MELVELGLTANESKVYELLLKTGSNTAVNLSTESKVPYGRIYTVLETLEKKGLVKVISGNVKKYSPADPDKLRQIIDDKIKHLMNINDQVREYKKFYDNNLKESIVVAKGKNSHARISRETKIAQKQSYSIRHDFDLSPQIVKQIREDLKKKLDIKTLGRFDGETKKNILEYSKLNNNFRPIGNEGINLEIIDEEEVLIELINSNTSVLIRDAAFAKIMKELFIKFYINTAYEPKEDSRQQK